MTQNLASLVLPKSSEEPPPIPVKFTLPEAGVVTLVIEDRTNHRVRNLVSETPFPAGENIAWWDGSDDLLRDPEAARHGVYHIPTRPVAPGTYKVRGLWHKPLKLHYEFSIYNAGKPAWETADKTGCWMTTHTPPTSIAVVPGSRTADGKPLVFMGAFVAEGGHGLQWLHEDGTKIGGQGWVGGNWTGAPTLAVDLGTTGRRRSSVLRRFGLGRRTATDGEDSRHSADQPILKQKLGDEIDPRRTQRIRSPPAGAAKASTAATRVFVLGGIAAHDGQLVCSLVRQNELLVVDIKSGKIAAREFRCRIRAGWPSMPKADCSCSAGRSWCVSHRCRASRTIVIASGLEDPRHVAVDAQRQHPDHRSWQRRIRCKVFSSAGKLLRHDRQAGRASDRSVRSAAS